MCQPFISHSYNCLWHLSGPMSCLWDSTVNQIRKISVTERKWNLQKKLFLHGLSNYQSYSLNTKPNEELHARARMSWGYYKEKHPVQPPQEVTTKHTMIFVLQYISPNTVTNFLRMLFIYYWLFFDLLCLEGCLSAAEKLSFLGFFVCFLFGECYICQIIAICICSTKHTAYNSREVLAASPWFRLQRASPSDSHESETLHCVARASDLQ